MSLSDSVSASADSFASRACVARLIRISCRTLSGSISSTSSRLNKRIAKRPLALDHLDVGEAAQVETGAAGGARGLVLFFFSRPFFVLDSEETLFGVANLGVIRGSFVCDLIEPVDERLLLCDVLRASDVRSTGDRMVSATDIRIEGRFVDLVERECRSRNASSVSLISRSISSKYTVELPSSALFGSQLSNVHFIDGGRLAVCIRGNKGSAGLHGVVGLSGENSSRGGAPCWNQGDDGGERSKKGAAVDGELLLRARWGDSSCWGVSRGLL